MYINSIAAERGDTAKIKNVHAVVHSHSPLIPAEGVSWCEDTSAPCSVINSVPVFLCRACSPWAWCCWLFIWWSSPTTLCHLKLPSPEPRPGAPSSGTSACCPCPLPRSTCWRVRKCFPCYNISLARNANLNTSHESHSNVSRVPQMCCWLGIMVFSFPTTVLKNSILSSSFTGTEAYFISNLIILFLHILFSLLLTPRVFLPQEFPFL